MNAIITKESNQIQTPNLFIPTEKTLSARPNWISHREINNLPDDKLQLLKTEALQEIIEGTLPNLISVCEELYFTFAAKSNHYNALQFVPVMQKLKEIDRPSRERFLCNPKSNHVLVQNSLIKIVLIHWTPGKYSNIHGHAAGGCVFKVLSGSLEEKRYTPDGTERHLATSTVHDGCMAYIDDTLAHHAVGNPFEAPAISLHAYTPGIH